MTALILLAWLAFWPAGAGLGPGVVIGRACQPDP